MVKAGGQFEMSDYPTQYQYSRRKHFVIWPLLIAVVFGLYQYFGSGRYVNPETGRVAHVALSEDQESALGLQSYQEVLSQSQVQTEGPEVDLVKRVMGRLIAATGDAGKSLDWEVSVLRDDQANAFCLPGGKMVVYTGILPIAQTEAGLATVLGHEMGHATSRHGSQRLLESKLANTLMSGAQASVMLGDMNASRKMEVMGALGAGTKYGVLLPFSRKHESEADEVGLYYMARAGYDPHEALAFWQRMEESSSTGRQPPEYLSTHPSHGTRIAALQSHMPRAEEEYAKSNHGGLLPTGAK
jgi:predicted Zn-dependent protease